MKVKQVKVEGMGLEREGRVVGAKEVEVEGTGLEEEAKEVEVEEITDCP